MHLLSTRSVKRYLNVLSHTAGNYETVNSQKNLLNSEDLQLVIASEGLVLRGSYLTLCMYHVYTLHIPHVPNPTPVVHGGVL